MLRVSAEDCVTYVTCNRSQLNVHEQLALIYYL